MRQVRVYLRRMAPFTKMPAYDPGFVADRIVSGIPGKELVDHGWQFVVRTLVEWSDVPIATAIFRMLAYEPTNGQRLGEE